MQRITYSPLIQPASASASASASTSTYSTRKNSGAAKRETLARKQIRSVKYAAPVIKA